MYKKILFGISLITTVLPVISMAQVVPLAASPTTTVNPLPLLCYDFQTTLKKGSQGDAVRRLQFFMTEEGINIPPQEYGVFGDATVAAVKAYQEKYGSDILVPQQMNEGNGILGKATRAELNATYGCSALDKEVSLQGVILKVNNISIDSNGITATFCNLTKGNIPSFPVRLRLNGIIRDFDITGAKQAGACVTNVFGYDTWGLTYDPGSVFTVVTLLDPLSMYKSASLQFPLASSTIFTVPVVKGPSVGVRGLALRSNGIQGTFCNAGTVDLTSFPVSITVNGSSTLVDVLGAYKHGTCTTMTWPYSNWIANYATGTVISATVLADPQGLYVGDVDKLDNAASVVGTP